MELIYITLAVYGMGAATALFPKKMEMAAHYCAVLAAVFGSGALLYQSAAYLMQGSGSLLSGSWAFLLSMLIGGAQFFIDYGLGRNSDEHLCLGLC
ncbi:MAG: hypothetical protein ACLRXQ_00975 [Phascolarctobacterium faecium]